MTTSPTAPQRYDAAVYIGRFQPFHHGHAALLREALTIASQCVVVIGSAHQARTPKNPFTWEERAELVRVNVADDERDRVRFLPLRDCYDAERWAGAVRAGVAALLPPDARSIALVGHFKDATSEYLRDFPSWRLVSAEPLPGIDATSIRDAYFGAAGGDVDAALAALAGQASQATLAFLRAWQELPHYAALVGEWQHLREYHAAWSSAPYPPVFVTVDAVVRCAGRVLLVQRAHAPGKGLWALPGGFIEPRETAYQSALRELREETGLQLLDLSMRQSLKASAVFDHPDRSQRGRTITHAFFFDFGDREPPDVAGADDAADAVWTPVEQLAAIEDRFLDDHFHILDHFLGVTER